jgi:hypothetical protein
VRFRFQPWQLAALLVLVCAAAVGVLEWRRHSQRYDASRLMQALPLNGAVKVFIDVEALRTSGLLDEIAGKKASEDSDYRGFADEIGFDYRTDLDSVAAAFINGGFYAAARGHFNWTRLNQYVRSQQGRCMNGICTMSGSQPNRMISFYALTSEVMALAVSDRPQGVSMISPGQSKGFSVPPAVLWVSAPGSSFKDPENAPAGTRSFLTPLADAREASFGIQPHTGAESPDTLEIQLDVACASPDAATVLAGVLTAKTDFLRNMIVRDKLAPDKSSLASVLVSGRFQAHESNVSGTWPMNRRVIETLISGQVK